MPPFTLGYEPGISSLPEALEQLIDWRWPDSLWTAYEMHSEECYTVWILDLDYSYNEWLATLSLDGRWTVSPRNVQCYDYETDRDLQETGHQWRRRARKIEQDTTPM